MAANYHDRFAHQSQHRQQPAALVDDVSERQEEVIDPNLYGPFGARYADTHHHAEQHISGNSHSGGWHSVETTEEHYNSTHQQLLHHHLQQPQRQQQRPRPYSHAASHSNRSSEQWETRSARHYRDSFAMSQQNSSSGPSPMTEGETKVDTSGQHSDIHPDQHGHGHERSGSLFDMVHSRGKRSGPHIEEHGEDIPVNFRHLVKRPIVRQWLHAGKLYREKDERKPSQYELFFDLIFVAVVNGIGHTTAESSSGINVLKFVLSFWPSFSIWTDVRKFLNVHGTDSVTERLLLLGWMVLLCGYCANVSGLEIVSATPEMLAMHAAGESGSEAAAFALDGGESGEHGSGELHRRAFGALAAALLKRSGGEGGGSAEEVELGAHLVGNYWFTESYHKAIGSAIAFFMVTKLWRVGIYFYYGASLPKFRRALWLNGFAMALITCIYLPVLLSSNPLVIMLVMSAGIVAELMQSYVVALAMMCFHGRKKRSGNHMFIPALSHEHSIERFVLFVILIVGESIISSNFVATDGTFGLTATYGRASLGIAISFLVIWLYYDADGCRVFQHALRRNSFTSITFCHLHFPLTAALILMAASLSTLVTSTGTVHGGKVWYFGGSLACVMACFGVIGLLHRNLDIHGTNLVPRWMRLTVRFLVAGAMAVIPLAENDWDSLYIMGIYVGILTFLVAFETIGKIGAVGRKYDAKRAAALHAGHSVPMDDLGSLADLPLTHAEKQKYKLDKKATWHPYSDLTTTEMGEEDVGWESEIGHLQEKTLSSGEKWAYAA